MTNEATNSEETPKKPSPRRGSKAAIDAEMAANAQAAKTTLAETDEAPAAVLCPSCEAPHKALAHWSTLKCETCDHEWPNPNHTTSSATPSVSWNDVVKASAERDAGEWEWEESEETIPVMLTSEDKARLIEENGVDQKEKDAVDAKIDEHKDKIKTLKAEADVILARTEERNRAASRGIQDRRETWKVGTCFAINTVRYVDRTSGRVMHERAIEDHERQVSLPLVSDEATAKAAQMNLGDVEPMDATESTDPEALLAAAQQGETDPADEPLDNDSADDDRDEDDDL